MRPLRATVCVLIFQAVLPLWASQSLAAEDGQNVILVLVDGLRWKEVFQGADERLISKEAGGVPNPDEVRTEYWRPTPEARREALMPFLWKAVAREGQVLGNETKNSSVHVTNVHWFSYPGWSEMTVGFADSRVNSNDPKPNPNPTVLEWLNKRPAFTSKVAAFAAWDVGAFILNRERCGHFVNVSCEPVSAGPVSPRQELLNELKAQVPSPWGCSEQYDALVFQSALEYLKANKPRVFFMAFGETDEWAHGNRYDNYLKAARLTDDLIRKLWETAQAMPEYRGRTTLIIANDHGRGDAPADWKSHGAKIDGSQKIWVAAMGPRIAPLGERSNTPPATLSQVAATVAACVGEDYADAVPQAAKPLDVMLKAK